MKEYTTLEMIEEIMKDNSLIFESKGYKVYISEIGLNNIPIIKWENHTSDYINPYGYFLLTSYTVKLKWTKVQQPVPFMEAVKAYHEGKDFKIILDDEEYVYKHDKNKSALLGCYFRSAERDMCGNDIAITTREILKGKCYILD